MDADSTKEEGTLQIKTSIHEPQLSDLNVQLPTTKMTIEMSPSDDFLSPFLHRNETGDEDEEEGEEGKESEKKEEEVIHIRRTIAEDLQWNLRTVSRLGELVLMHFANTFVDRPLNLNLLSPVQRSIVVKHLPLNLPLPLVASRVSDEDYWKRRSAASMDEVVDISQFGGSWKRFFFERYVQRLVENFVPRLTNPETLFSQVKVGGPFVIRLDIGQLLPPVERKETKEASDELDEVPEEVLEVLMAKDHLRVNHLLALLPCLQELRVTYGVEHCGMNFDWNLFRFTINDCAWLTELIAHCKTLKAVTIHRSRVDDVRMLMLSKALTNHPHISELRLPHNILRDDGARTIARYVDGNEILQVLDLQNNEIGYEGGYALGYALAHNNCLLSLNLRLNLLKDEGMRMFSKSLIVNNTLTDLNLSCNGITRVSSRSIGELVEKNSTLRNMDLSGNALTVECGQQLVRSMEHNCSLVDLDLRLTDCGPQNLYCVGLYLAENKVRQLRCQEKSTKYSADFARTSRLMRYCLKDQ